MRVGYMGNVEHQNTRVWIAEMRKRGAHPVALVRDRPTWEIEWAPILLKKPPLKGLGIGRRNLARQVAVACEQHQLDLLHTQEANRLSFWARASSFRPRMITCWGSDVLRLDPKPIGYKLGVRMALSTADAVTVGSRDLLVAAVRAGAREDRCLLAGWGVDTKQFRPSEGARRRVRADWGLEDREVLLSTRSHKPLYRVDAILRAFALARREHDRLALVVAAAGPETEHLKSLAHELGVDDDVRFIGFVRNDSWPTVPDVCAGADVFCSIPETDGGPLSVLEAMASELPVVVSDVPVMREWITPSKNGFIWSSGEIASLSALILQALAARQAIGHEARLYVQRHHERSEEMDRVYELYESLVQRNGRGHA